MLVLTVLSLLLLIAIGIGLFSKAALSYRNIPMGTAFGIGMETPQRRIRIPAVYRRNTFRNGFVDCHRVAHLPALSHFPDRICQFVGKTYRISHIRHFGRIPSVVYGSGAHSSLYRGLPINSDPDLSTIPADIPFWPVVSYWVS